MNLVKTRRVKWLLISVILAQALESKAGEDPCVLVEVEPVAQLTVQQVGQLATRQILSNSLHTASLWVFDVEDQPKKMSMTAVAFLSIGTGDLGGRPIGALIWTSEVTTAKLVKNGKRGFIVVVGNARRGCSQSSIQIMVSDVGKVLVGRKVLGQVQ